MEIFIVCIFLFKKVCNICRCLIDICQGIDHQVKVCVTGLILSHQLKTGLDWNKHCSRTVFFRDAGVHLAKKCCIIFVYAYNCKII